MAHNECHAVTDHRKLRDAGPMPHETFIGVYLPRQGSFYLGWYVSHDHEEIVFNAKANSHKTIGSSQVRWEDEPIIMVWRRPPVVSRFAEAMSKAVTDRAEYLAEGGTLEGLRLSWQRRTFPWVCSVYDHWPIWLTIPMLRGRASSVA